MQFQYAMIVPIALLDVSICLFPWIYFPARGIARVRRGSHIVIDRHRLSYLNGIQKLNCLYCGYGTVSSLVPAKWPAGPNNFGAPSSMR